jgi:hypothetical protein
MYRRQVADQAHLFDTLRGHNGTGGLYGSGIGELETQCRFFIHPQLGICMYIRLPNRALSGRATARYCVILIILGCQRIRTTEAKKVARLQRNGPVLDLQTNTRTNLCSLNFPSQSDKCELLCREKNTMSRFDIARSKRFVKAELLMASVVARTFDWLSASRKKKRVHPAICGASSPPLLQCRHRRE